jgi:hypothetical protein
MLLATFLPVINAANLGYHRGLSGSKAGVKISPLQLTAVDGGAQPLAVTVTLQRTTIEQASVNVPVTARHFHHDRLDADLLASEAVALGHEDGISWMPEGQPVIEVSPNQRPQPAVPFYEKYRTALMKTCMPSPTGPASPRVQRG